MTVKSNFARRCYNGPFNIFVALPYVCHQWHYTYVGIRISFIIINYSEELSLRHERVINIEIGLYKENVFVSTNDFSVYKKHIHILFA